MKLYESRLEIDRTTRRYRVGVSAEGDNGNWHWYLLKAKRKDMAIIEQKLGVANLLGNAARRAEEKASELNNLAHALRSKAMKVIHG